VRAWDGSPHNCRIVLATFRGDLKEIWELLSLKQWPASRCEPHKYMDCALFATEGATARMRDQVEMQQVLIVPSCPVRLPLPHR
jgi:hypothetical protein